MKKLSIVSLLAIMLTSYSCADQDTPEKPQGKWEPIGQQGTCNEECPKQECPKLECNGEECPSCPACEVCKVCQNGGECDTSALNNEISRLQRDLDTQKDATEECLGDLDTCTNDLKTTGKVKTIKSGSRLIPYKYVGEDGSQWPSTFIFDSKKNVRCYISDFSESGWVKYGCPSQIYCTTSSKYETDKSYVDPALLQSPNPSSTYCHSIYETIDVSSIFRTQISDAVNVSLRRLGDSYFTDPDCLNPVEDPFVSDETCRYKSSSMLYEIKYETKDAINSCIDGTLYQYAGNTGDITYVLYKPKNTTSFATIYYKNSSGNCYDYGYKNVIFLTKVKEITKQEIMNEATRNRESFCRQLCAAINKEAVEEDWAKVNLVPVDQFA